MRSKVSSYLMNCGGLLRKIGEVANLAYRTLRHFPILTRWNVKIFLEFTYHHFEIT